MRLILRRYSTGVGVGGFLNTAGTNTGAVSSLQAFTSGISTGSIRPTANSTTALTIRDATGGTNLMVFDTINNIITVGKQNATSGTILLKAPYDTNPAQTLFTEYSTGGIGLGQYMYQDNSATWLSSFAYGPIGRAAFIVGQTTCKFMSAPPQNVAAGSALTSQPTVFFSADGTTFEVSGTVRADGLRLDAASPTPSDGDIVHGSTGFTLYNIDSGTNAVINHVIANRQSSGTPAAGFGVGFAALLESSTTVDQNAGRLTFAWSTATHASRAAVGKLTAYYTSTEREAITWGANSTVSLLSFHDVTTPIARPVLATGAGRTADDIITVLQNYGLVKQS